ncbi:hypothetical protein HPB52_019941 [Rhipicephalus sanguineus]|uniref:5'-nucleotidase n=1 Tax=Rhipicephalus sanguineus TaxID=34632 RepID=A0A9D4Q2N0_RHISA|nr:hypothetical protein HPB52_019941 [Rhipicephalus sanguineus]
MVLKKMGAKIVIAITHIGYMQDIELMRSITDVDLVIGGHTNTFLYNGTDHPPENVPAGPYPTTVKMRDGTTGLVAQAFWFGKYLGFLRVTFDDNGRVKSWSGNPILINSSIPEDPHILTVIEPHRETVYQAMRVRVGSSRVSLEHAEDVCRLRECNLGNLAADAYFHYYSNRKPRSRDMWSNVNAAIVNGGSLRAPIPRTGTDHPKEDKPEGPYPYVVNRTDGSKALVVQDFRFGKYLGRLDVTFNSTGHVVSWGGNPVLLNVSVEEGPIEYEALEKYIAKMSPIWTPDEGRIKITWNKTDEEAVLNYTKSIRQNQKCEKGACDVSH